MTVQVADEEKIEQFMSKLKDTNFKAVTHTIKICAVQFIPMEEFNKKPIISENYNIELKNYISEKSNNLKDFLENSKNELEENGLFVEETSQSVKDYSPFDILKTALFEDSSNDFSTVLDKLLGITPPRTTINPKLASSFAC